MVHCALCRVAQALRSDSSRSDLARRGWEIPPEERGQGIVGLGSFCEIPKQRLNELFLIIPLLLFNKRPLFLGEAILSVL